MFVHLYPQIKHYTRRYTCTINKTSYNKSCNSLVYLLIVYFIPADWRKINNQGHLHANTQWNRVINSRKEIQLHHYKFLKGNGNIFLSCWKDLSNDKKLSLQFLQNWLVLEIFSWKVSWGLSSAAILDYNFSSLCDVTTGVKAV